MKDRTYTFVASHIHDILKDVDRKELLKRTDALYAVATSVALLDKMDLAPVVTVELTGKDIIDLEAVTRW